MGTILETNCTNYSENNFNVFFEKAIDNFFENLLVQFKFLIENSQ